MRPTIKPRNSPTGRPYFANTLLSDADVASWTTCTVSCGTTLLAILWFTMASATVFTPRTASWLEDAVKRNTSTDVCACTDTDRWSVNWLTDKPSSCAAGARMVSSAWRTDA